MLGKCIVNAWMSDHNLLLALSKTVIVILTKNIETIIPLRVGKAVIQTTHAPKCFEVMGTIS